MNKLQLLSHNTIASEEVMYSTPSQYISHENSFSFKLGEFINFKGAQICSGCNHVSLQEYFYLDSELDYPRWRAV